MGFADALRGLFGRKKHRDVRSFDHDLQAAGKVAGRVDRGFKEVPIEKIVGSVSRWQNLRSDFFYKTGEVTGRFRRVGQAMEQGKSLPPLELYKVKEQDAPSQYYVVDGHHRVAMAKQLEISALDAHVVEYKVKRDASEPAPNGETAAPQPEPRSGAGS